ncbi:MAG TPA: YCF48-related protein [Caldimonas sp.]|nr:YCF48-related protein [Caldimonas sp.]
MSAQGVVLPDALERPAATVKQLEHAIFEAVTAAGDRLVAVGERGLIALSDDGGKSWRQARVPVSVGLTAVAFTTSQAGWAVGHAGVVLRTADGGENWSKELDGIKVAQIVAGSLPAGASSERVDHLLAEGPDKPFLDVHFRTADDGFVVGAFGLMLRTRDGGKTWTSLTLEVPNPNALHLYAIRPAGGSLYVAGEQGLVLRSDDGGVTFTAVATPYRGSWFTVVGDSSGKVLLAGLRGNAFFTTDRGATWQPAGLSVPVSVTAAVLAPDGHLLIANQGGQIFAADAIGAPLDPWQGGLPSPTGLCMAADGTPVAATLNGMRRLARALARPKSP